ncbi:MAG: winged helix-turn-helix transcriptional regulator [Betaproteobacteria bacterium]|nr:MAG: winged helix-turn-helix transcriptional regulator [Betaproteobacteria bacterium]
MAQHYQVDALECVKRQGQCLDSEISEETGLSLTAVRERLAALTGSGVVIACKLTRFEDGKPVEAYLYRASGYIPPPAPGRKPKPTT